MTATINNINQEIKEIKQSTRTEMEINEAQSLTRRYFQRESEQEITNGLVQNINESRNDSPYIPLVRLPERAIEFEPIEIPSSLSPTQNSGLVYYRNGDLFNFNQIYSPYSPLYEAFRTTTGNNALEYVPEIPLVIESVVIISKKQKIINQILDILKNDSNN